MHLIQYLRSLSMFFALKVLKFFNEKSENLVVFESFLYRFVFIRPNLKLKT